MDKWIMKQEDDDFFMGVLQEGDRLHPRDTNGPYVKSEDVNLILAQRDHLAAENAELQRSCNALSDDLSRMHQLELDAKCHSDLEKSHAIMVQVVADRDAQLAAANATLDRLRELVGPNRTISNATCMKMVDILYPEDEA